VPLPPVTPFALVNPLLPSIAIVECVAFGVSMCSVSADMLVSVSTKTTKTTVLARMDIANNHEIIMVTVDFFAKMWHNTRNDVRIMRARVLKP